MYRHRTDQTGTPLRARNTNPESGGCKLLDQNEVGGSTAPKNNRKSTSRSKNSQRRKSILRQQSADCSKFFFYGQMPNAWATFDPSVQCWNFSLSQKRLNEILIHMCMLHIELTCFWQLNIRYWSWNTNGVKLFSPRLATDFSSCAITAN